MTSPTGIPEQTTTTIPFPRLALLREYVSLT
jgi:hypothetical protein